MTEEVDPTMMANDSEQTDDQHWQDVELMDRASRAAARNIDVAPAAPVTPDRKKYTAGQIAGAATVGAIVLGGGGALVNATVGGEIRDGLTPDKVVASTGFTLFENDALQTDLSKAAHELVLEKKIDPAKVDFSSLPDLANTASGEALKVFDEKELQPGNSFKLTMTDTGNGYKFEVKPDDSKLAITD